MTKGNAIKILILIIVLSAITACGTNLTGDVQSSVIQDDDPLEAEFFPAFEPEDIEGFSVEVTNKTEQNCSIVLNYPVTEDLAINRDLLSLVNTYADNFIRRQEGEKGNLDIRFKLYQAGGASFGFLFDIYTYTAKNGVALSRECVMYDAYMQERVQMGYLFGEQASYISRLSEAVKEQLVEEYLYDAEHSAALAGELTEEYSRFVFDDTFIYIYFSDSEIPPVKINYHDLNDSLTPEDVPGEPTPEPTFGPEPTVTPEPTVEPEEPQTTKYIALTFDDGPSSLITSGLLDILKEYDVKATFFVLGQNSNKNKDIIKRMYDEGHSVGNHTYGHVQLTTVSNSSMMKQIADTNNLLLEITGEKPTLFRPPYGAYSNKILKYLGEEGMSAILWSIDPQDWKVKDAVLIAKHIIEKAHDGGIILLHDLYEPTLNSVETIIRALTKKGYVFVTVSELINMNCGLEPGEAYRNWKEAE